MQCTTTSEWCTLPGWTPRLFLEKSDNTLITGLDRELLEQSVELCCSEKHLPNLGSLWSEALTVGCVVKSKHEDKIVYLWFQNLIGLQCPRFPTKTFCWQSLSTTFCVYKYLFTHIHFRWLKLVWIWADFFTVNLPNVKTKSTPIFKLSWFFFKLKRRTGRKHITQFL